MQSHGGQVRHLADIPRWGDDVTDFTSPARFARRPRLKAAVLGRSDESDLSPITASNGGIGPAERSLVYTVTGRILDVSPHILVLQTARGEQRFPLAASAEAWRGGSISPAALRPGDHAIVRRSLPGGPVVDRIWAEVGRVTGTIIERAGPARLLVDEGPAKGRRIVMIAPEATRRIQVRFPRLEPGYLVDVIGLKHDGFLKALIPATSQPPYRAGHAPAPPMVSGHIPDPVSGTAVWHEPGEEPESLLGLAYPALDPETSCEHGAFMPPSGLRMSAMNDRSCRNRCSACSSLASVVTPDARCASCLRNRATSSDFSTRREMRNRSFAGPNGRVARMSLTGSRRGWISSSAAPNAPASGTRSWPLHSDRRRRHSWRRSARPVVTILSRMSRYSGQESMPTPRLGSGQRDWNCSKMPTKVAVAPSAFSRAVDVRSARRARSFGRLRSKSARLSRLPTSMKTVSR